MYFGGSLIQDLETADIHRFDPKKEVVHDTACIPAPSPMTCMPTPR